MEGVGRSFQSAGLFVSRQPALRRRFKIAGLYPACLVRFHRIGRDSHDVCVIALDAIECPDIEPGWPLRDARKYHPGAAFWAARTLRGGERKTGGRKSLWHQPSNACASSHVWLLKGLRKDRAT